MSKKKLKITKVQKKRLASIISGAAFFLLGGVFRLFGLEIVSDVMFAAGGACAGVMCVVRAVRGIAKGDFFDENTLMTVAAVGAVALGEYPECAAVMILYQVGELFQSIAVGRSRKAISALGSLCPDSCEALRGGEYAEVPTAELSVGDTVRIKPGERIPADCEITTGSTAVDTSPVTGESVPRDACVGDTVYSGCINQSGLIEARVLKKPADSAAGRIMKLTETASDRKTRSEAFITRFAKVYTPAVTLFAACIAFLVPLGIQLFGGVPYGETFPEWGAKALSMLVISCPCALVISVPLGYFCGLGNASKNGILIKGSSFMDTLAKVDTAVFDKTGTLTVGSLSVSEITVKREGISETEIITLAASAEKHSSHPIAKAICAFSGEKSTLQVSDVRELAGKGVEARLADGRSVSVIRPREKVDGTAVEVDVDGETVGIICLSDTVKPSAAKALAELKEQGIKKTVILTGDNRAAAERVRTEVGADEVLAELMPEEKFTNIEELCGQGSVMYVGDGINDSPSLARADVGVAIGVLGSDAAIETADVVLMDNDLCRLSYGVRLARRTTAIVKSNIVISLGVKLGVLALAAAGQVGMWVAVLADVGMCIVAVSNSMRLLRNKKR